MFKCRSIIRSGIATLCFSMAGTVLAQLHMEPGNPLPTPSDQQSLAIPNNATSLVDMVNAPSTAEFDRYPINKIPVADSVKIPVLDFKNTDIRDVLRALGMQYNVNIYCEPNVNGTVSLYLTDISVKNAIDFIVKKNNFAYSVDNSIVKVYKYQEPPPPPPAKPKVQFHVQDGLIDISVTNLPASEIAKLFADSAGMNVVIDGQQDKAISSRLTKLKVDKAIKVLFEGNGFDVTAQEGVFYAQAKQWGQQNSESGNQQSAQLKRLSITISKTKTVTMEVDNAPLDQAIRTIAVQSGINVIIYDQISGTITAKFSDLAIDDVLRYLLQNTKFTFWKNNEIYFIGSREMSQQKTSLVIPLKHIMADEAQFGRILPPHITSSAVLKFDKEHNAIIVVGSFDVIAQAQEYIEKLDKPIPQVLIEALVVDFNVSKFREWGISLFTGGRDSSGTANQERFLPDLDLKPGRISVMRALQEISDLLGINQVVNLPKNFRASIQALEGADLVKINSTPQIATINGNPASITIGETRYFKLRKETRGATATSDNIIGTDERFEKIDLNTSLEVTPWVMDQGYVMVKIHPKFQTPRSGGSSDQPPSTDNRELESMVRLRNGQSIILGGQRQTSEVVNRKGIPFLSGIPIIGFIFSQKTVTTTESQMMIFLTPHVYYGDEGEVSPEDYVGKDVGRFLDKGDPDRVKSRRVNGKNLTPRPPLLQERGSVLETPSSAKKKSLWVPSFFKKSQKDTLQEIKPIAPDSTGSTPNPVIIDR